MTTTEHEPAVHPHPALLDFLDEHELRYEVIDGTVVVTPPVRTGHERVVVRLMSALMRLLPEHLEVFPAGVGCYFEGSSFVLPDVCVVRSEDVEEDGIHRTPLLVVEVRSPSTRRRDVTEKRAIYAEWGVPSYWLVDPQARELTVLSLHDGSYVETARGQHLELHEPYPVNVDLR